MVVEGEKDEWQGDPQASVHLDLNTVEGEQKGAQWSPENRPPESACQIVDYHDLDHGIDQLGDFAEQSLAQEVPQYRNENQQKTEQTIENAREIEAEILIALGRSE